MRGKWLRELPIGLIVFIATVAVGAILHFKHRDEAPTDPPPPGQTFSGAEAARYLERPHR